MKALNDEGRLQRTPSVYSMCMTVCIFKKVFTCFGCAGPALLRGLFSSCGEQGLLSSRGAKASHCPDLSRWGAPALGLRASVLAAPGFWGAGSAGVALQRVGSSWIKDRTLVSCPDCCFLYRWATSQAPVSVLMYTWVLRAISKEDH